MVLPATITNETANNFMLTISAHFCESVNTDRAYRELEWLKTQKLGWSIAGYYPSRAGLFTFVRYLGTLLTTVIGALLAPSLRASGG